MVADGARGRAPRLRSKMPDDSLQPVQGNALLPDRVAEQLRAMVLSGELAPSAQLPTEPELSRLLNVSRGTLRAALDQLAREGVVVRRRGVGTFVAEQPLGPDNLNLNWGVTEIIRATGATPGTVDMMLRREPASPRVAQRLQLAPGSEVIVVDRVRLADARRVVCTQDYIATAQFDRAGLTLDDLRDYLNEHQSMYGFLRDKLAHKFDHAKAWLRPITATPVLAQRLQILVGSGVLHIEQVDYDADNLPVVTADEYHVADAFTFTVHRSQLGPR